MRYQLFILLLVSVMLIGCEGANVVANMRQSGLEGTDIQIRCEPCDMRDSMALNNLFAKYDGWSVLYISEFTTGNIKGTNAVICFDRIKK